MGASWPTPAHRTPVEPPVPAVDGLPQELRQPAVGQCAPLGLAEPAVDDLVGLEGDTPQGLATAGARLYGAIVHGEAESELGLRQTARPGALVLQGGVEHRVHGGDQVGPLVGGERAQGGERRDPRRVADVVGVAPVSYTHLTLPTKRIV